MKRLYLAVLLALTATAPMTANALLIYNTWSTNEGTTGNYILSVAENGDFFDVSLTVDPWNAEAFGLFIDLGDLDIGDDTVTSISPVGEISLWATDTTNNGCGPGCNLNGLSPTLVAPDAEWEWVFRLGAMGFDSIQTFGLSIARNGATESNWGTVGIRAQQLCSGDDLLPGDEEACEDSDKSFGVGTPSTPPTEVPEPGSLALLGAGLLGLGLMRRRRTG